MNVTFKPWSRRLAWALPMIALLAGCDDDDVRLTYGHVTVRDPDRPVVFRDEDAHACLLWIGGRRLGGRPAGLFCRLKF